MGSIMVETFNVLDLCDESMPHAVVRVASSVSASENGTL